MFKRAAIAGLYLFLCTTASQAAVDLLDFIPDAEEPLLATTGVDADQYLADAIAQGDGTIYLPRGTLKFDETIHCKKRIHLIGEGRGHEGGPSPTLLVFDPNISGIVAHGADTGPNGLEDPPTTDCKGSIFEGFKIQGGGTVGHGIWLRTRASVRDVMVDAFGENCIHIFATVATTHSTWSPFTAGNANLWRIDNVFLRNCGLDGLHIEGQDANAGLATLVDARLNGRYGIQDLSFLGNTLLAPHTATNGIGSYKISNPNARFLVLGPYSEGGEGFAELGGRGIMIGGFASTGGVKLGTLVIPTPNDAPARPRVITGSWDTGGASVYPDIPGRPVQTVRRSYSGNSAMDFYVTGDTEPGYTDVVFNGATGTWRRVWGPQPTQADQTGVLDAVTTTLSTTATQNGYKDEAGNLIPPGQLIIPNCYWGPSPTVAGRYTKVCPTAPAIP